MSKKPMKNFGRRQFIGTLAKGAALTSVVPFLGCSKTIAPTRPNIIFIMADDMGFADLSIYGRKDYRTPVLDQLASDGVLFSQAYASPPICTPNRVGFMTGRYPARHPIGLKEPLSTSSGADVQLGLSPEPPTVPVQLKKAGYTNALFGKWHLGWKPEFQPDKHGFDEAFGPLGGAMDYIDHHDGRGTHDLYHNGQEVYREGYLTDLFTEHAVDFIRQDRQPFFLSMQYTAPHWPWQRRGDPAYPLDRPLSDDGLSEIYPDMVKALDEGIGQILSALQELGIEENTLVIFKSDNGGERYSDMGEFTGRKGQVWEGGIRIPQCARWPGIIPAGANTNQVTITFDWSATILAAASVSPLADYPFDGIDLMPVMTGEVPVQERTLFWRVFQRRQQGAVRSGDWKYIQDKEGEHFFNLSIDPGEENNLASNDPDKFKELKSLYAAWEAEMLTPIPL